MAITADKPKVTPNDDLLNNILQAKDKNKPIYFELTKGNHNVLTEEHITDIINYLNNKDINEYNQSNNSELKLKIELVDSEYTIYFKNNDAITIAENNTHVIEYMLISVGITNFNTVIV